MRNEVTDNIINTVLFCMHGFTMIQHIQHSGFVCVRNIILATRKNGCFTVTHDGTVQL